MKADQVMREFVLDAIQNAEEDFADPSERATATAQARNMIVIEVPEASTLPPGRYLVAVSYTGAVS